VNHFSDESDSFLEFGDGIKLKRVGKESLDDILETMPVSVTKIKSRDFSGRWGLM
jgi:hypothetical protein